MLIKYYITFSLWAKLNYQSNNFIQINFHIKLIISNFVLEFLLYVF